jgi:hypothetical protein
MIRRYESSEMAGYAGACHRAALCADQAGSNPPYVLPRLNDRARDLFGKLGG